jgi:hypothetical protein
VEALLNTAPAFAPVRRRMLSVLIDMVPFAAARILWPLLIAARPVN